MKTLVAITALSLSATMSASAGTVVCQPIGDAATCTDGTVAMPFGGDAYITRQPRDAWGQPAHRGHEHHNEQERN